MSTVPLSGTNIRLLSGVPFSNDYKNTRWFDSVTDQTNYFGGKTIIHSMSDANFQRIEGHSFIRVNKSIDELWSTNYLMFQNAQYNNKWFYGFVTKLEYVQKNSTDVHFQIDIFQTWKFDMNFKPSYVVREHCKLWNSDGTPVINTVDEGLSYGSEYDTTYVNKYIPYEDIFFLVIVAKKTMHNNSDKKITPILNGSPQPLSFYIHPFKLDGTSPTVEIGGFPIALNNLTDVLKNLYSGTDAVNNIVSLYITDYFGYNIPHDSSTGKLTISQSFMEYALIGDTQDPDSNFYTLHVHNLPNYEARIENFGLKWSGYTPVKESKLMMHPYTQLILDDFKGNRATFKTEYINNLNLEIIVKGSAGTSNKVSYGIQDYNFNANGLQYQMSDEFALINNTPNDVPIITDLLSAYLQGNKNSLLNQVDSTVFNGVMGVVGNVSGAVASGLSANPAGVVAGGIGAVQGAGNTVLQLQGMQAKVKDITNVPPSISKMGSNTYYTVGNQYNGVYIIKKQIKQEYINKLTHFFNMFGYKVNEVKLPNFHTRQYWNYVETKSCNITGNFNNDDLQELKSVFDNGITFWHTDDIGNYSLTNEVIA